MIIPEGYENQVITISKADAELIRRYFLPHNENKVRRPRDLAERAKVRDACRRFKLAIAASKASDQ